MKIAKVYTSLKNRSAVMKMEACFIGNVMGEQYECEEGSNLIFG